MGQATEQPDRPQEAADPVARLEELERAASIGFWEWDVLENRIEWSPGLYQIYGVTPEEFLATYEGFLDLVHEEDRERVNAAVQRAFVEGGRFAFDHRVVRPDGNVRIFRARGHSVLDPSGRAVRMVGTGQDVTDYRMAEQAATETESLRANDQFRSEFISKAAHELRTPLLPIRVQSHILATLLGPAGDARVAKALASLDRNLERLNRLIDDLLEAARLQSTRLKLDKAVFDLSSLIDEAVDAFQPVAQQVGLRLEWRSKPGLTVEADPQRLLQVAHNLLGNAMKFTPRGGVVAVELARYGPKARITVQDNGRGLSPDEVQDLFQPFSQTASAKDSPAPGTGLGLYISKGLVDQHGGRIWAESPGPNQGATFMVELPLSSKSPQPLAVTASAVNWWRDAGPSERAQKFKELI